MQDFKGKVAVITGAGSGIGRELTRQLVHEGCGAAICDLDNVGMEETLRLCREDNPDNALVTGFVCDVADEDQVQQFVEDTRIQHDSAHIDILINNAGINGGGSFVESSREEWDRAFNICWSGVYLVTRNFFPMLKASNEGHLVNMSSANAIRAVLGGHVPHTAYSTAKFAVRGFSEALIHDFRFNAPHLSVSVVMPGHTGTDIISNSLKVLGQNTPDSWSTNEIELTKRRWKIAGQPNVDAMSEDDVRAAGIREIQNMKELGLPAAEAAKIILDGVKRKQWRILIGSDTTTLDHLVRDSPETAYDPDFVTRWQKANAKYLNSDD
ncbi:MAG: SDR family NAD(P)-dependent oxidoreductase [bacterium]